MGPRSTSASATGVVLAALLALGCGTAGEEAGTTDHTRGPPITNARSAVAASPLGQRTRSTGCHVRGVLPDPSCTPGAIFTTATTSRICTPGYSRSVRHVPESLKRSVYDEYGITSHAPRSYEVDHLVPLELGGSNSIANLWPEVAPGYHRKDTIENRLHDAVCSGLVSLPTAQRQIARDWRHTAA